MSDLNQQLLIKPLEPTGTSLATNEWHEGQNDLHYISRKDKSE
jgi:hypothetical protein